MSSAVYTKQFYEHNRETSLRSAQEIVPIVLELIRPRRVVELGCGVGAWLHVLKSYGVDEVLGVDGDYVDREQLLIPEEQFLSYDLEKPFRINKTFDLAISLEVAEHLPSDCAETFVDSLTQLAPVVLFSAAIPFQGGAHHVNEQWPDFWAAIFRRHSFVPIDCIRRRVWQNERVDWWYAQNTLIYANGELIEEIPGFREALERTFLSQLNVVHPARYLEAVSLEHHGIRSVLRLARSVALRSVTVHARRKINVLGRWVR